MAAQQSVFAGLHSAEVTVVDEQRRVESWLYNNYLYEFQASTAVLSRAEFHQRYMAPAPETAAALDAMSWYIPSTVSSGSNGVPLRETQRGAPREWLRDALKWVLPGGYMASGSSVSTDTSTSWESDFSWGLRSPRQPASLTGVMPGQLEIDEVGSGYEADESSNADSDSSWAPGAHSSSAPRGSDASSSSSSSSSSDSEAEDIFRKLAEVTREHNEQMQTLRERAASTTPVKPPSSETLLPPAAYAVVAANERLAELTRNLSRATEALHTRVVDSYGEYKAEVPGSRSLSARSSRLSELSRRAARLGTHSSCEARDSAHSYSGGCLVWPTVTCESGKECHPAMTTSER